MVVYQQVLTSPKSSIRLCLLSCGGWRCSASRWRSSCCRLAGCCTRRLCRTLRLSECFILWGRFSESFCKEGVELGVDGVGAPLGRGHYFGVAFAQPFFVVAVEKLGHLRIRFETLLKTPKAIRLAWRLKVILSLG